MNISQRSISPYEKELEQWSRLQRRQVMEVYSKTAIKGEAAVAILIKGKTAGMHWFYEEYKGQFMDI